MSNGPAGGPGSSIAAVVQWVCAVGVVLVRPGSECIVELPAGWAVQQHTWLAAGWRGIARPARGSAVTVRIAAVWLPNSVTHEANLKRISTVCQRSLPPPLLPWREWMVGGLGEWVWLPGQRRKCVGDFDNAGFGVDRCRSLVGGVVGVSGVGVGDS